MNVFSIDVEEWYNILDVPGEIPIENWGQLECRLEANMDKLLELLDQHQVKATMFWLGYFAERYPKLLQRCHEAGHEIASHGYAHVLAYKSGREAFKEDITKSKKLLEDIIGNPVIGFRAAGFSTVSETPWTFDEIKAAGYLYDSSVFPAKRGHGGISDSPLTPYLVQTEFGELLEVPQSVLDFRVKRLSLFGGGYLRLFPAPLIRSGIARLETKERPFILYVHPREIDPLHPRLEMNKWRKFKSYVNLKSTYPKLEMLCKTYSFSTMEELYKKYILEAANRDNR